MSRSVYTRKELARLLEPQSIAIVGVSQSAASFGTRTIENLAGFAGRLYPVNPKYDEVAGLPCYPALNRLPEAPDCVVIAVPRDGVEDVARQAIEAGAGGLIVFTSGLGETGRPDRIEQQRRLADMARAADVRLLGPNCLGVINNLFRAVIMFQAGVRPQERNPLRIGLVSQSGALGTTLAQSMRGGVGFTHVLAAGNSADIDVCDLVSYLTDVPECRSIALTFEGVPSGERLLEAGERARAAGKPVIVYKAANGKDSAEAALSHTGSLAGSSAAYRSVFDRLGFITVDGLEDVVETASFCAKAEPPEAKGVAVMAVSGGAAVIAADMAEAAGVRMPQPAAEAQVVLNARVPEFGSPRNPCDVTGQVINDPDSFAACSQALLQDPTFGVLLLPEVNASEVSARRASVVTRMAKDTTKPICVVWLSGWLEGPGADVYERDANVAIFRSMRRCYNAIAGWQRFHDGLKEKNAVKSSLVSPQARDEVRRQLSAISGSLDERRSKAIAGLYGVPVPVEILAVDAASAAMAAKEIGFPVAAKINSADLPHKTEAGGVRLNLASAAEVETAFDEICRNARRYKPGAVIDGVLIQPMAARGVELMIGSTNDPQFGPLIVVGRGGVEVELWKDVATELAPVSTDKALNMLQRLRCFPLLDGFRGAAKIDLDRLADIVARVSELAATNADLIEAIDINPLVCRADGIVAVDALVVGKQP